MGVGEGGWEIGGLNGSLQFCRNFTSVSKAGRPATKNKKQKKGVSGASPERRWLSQDKKQPQQQQQQHRQISPLGKRQMGQAIKVQIFGQDVCR